MFTITYAAAILSTTYAVLAVAFLFHDRKQITAALAGYLFSAAWWIGGNAAADVSYTHDALIFTSRVAFAAGMANIFCFLLLVDLLVERTIPSGRRLAVYSVPILLVTLLGISNYGIVGTFFPANAPAEILPGVAYTIALFVFLGAFAYGIIRLVYGLRKETAYQRRRQLLYTLIGLLITLFGQILFDIILPLLGEVSLYSLGPITSIFFVLCCGYAITRHKLIDLRIVVQRGAIYTILLAGILALYISLLGIIEFFLGYATVGVVVVSGGVTCVIGIFSAPKIERYFRKATDRIFFKDTYEYAPAMHALSGVLYTNTQLAGLIAAAEATLTSILRAASVRIVFPGSEQAASRNLIIPIEVDGVAVAHIYAGPKKSGDPYTKQDLQLLETFAYQAATALSRAHLYEEVRIHAEELERRVAERTQELQRLQEMQTKMMIDISHNLQTPLAVFQNKLDRMKPVIHNDEQIRGLEQSLASLSSFIYDLLKLSRLEQVEHTEEVLIDLSDLVAEAIEEVEVIAETRTVRVEKTITPNVVVLGNVQQLREIIMNVTSNALKYMRPQGPKKLTISLSAKEHRAHLVIRDTGIGISPEALPHIFERFYRAPDAKPSVKGSGLGLAITKRMVEQHRGTISVASTLGEGSVFTIELPLAR